MDSLLKPVKFRFIKYKCANSLALNQIKFKSSFSMQRSKYLRNNFLKSSNKNLIKSTQIRFNSSVNQQLNELKIEAIANNNNDISFKDIFKNEAIDISDFKIPDAPTFTSQDFLNESIITISDLNLSPFFPPYYIYNLLTFMHDNINFNWVATIVSSCLLFRVCTIPFNIIQKRILSETMDASAILKDVQKELSDAQLLGNQMELIKSVKKMNDVMKDNNVKNYIKKKKITLVLFPLLQGTIFASFFICLRKMANFPITSLKDEKFLWCLSLSEPDPYYLLPLLSSFILHFNLRFNVDIDTTNLQSKNSINFVRYAVPCIVFILISSFPSCLSVYWFTSNSFSLFLATLYTNKSFKKMFKIPTNKIVQKKNEDYKKPFFSRMNDVKLAIKDSYTIKKNKKRASNILKDDFNNFERSGLGPVQKTYKYDPTKLKEN